MENESKPQDAPEQEAREQEINQETALENEMIQALKRKLKWEATLEVVWWAIIACIVLAGVTAAISGQWHRTVNNGLWLFVAWMYWRQTNAQTNELQRFIDLLKDNLSLRRQNYILKKIQLNNNKIIECYNETRNSIQKRYCR